MSDFKRILLIKPSSLGDIVHAMPVVAAFKQRWPSAHLTWLVKRQWSEIVQRIEGVDAVWAVDPSLGSWVGQAMALRAQRFDLVVDLQGLLRSALVGRMTGCAQRVGFANGREGSPWLYSQRVAVPTPEMHAVDRYLLMAAAVGAPVENEPQFRFRLLSQDVTALRELFRRKGIDLDAPWVAMNVSARWQTKRWPAASFAAVATQLAARGIGPLVVIGGPDEREASGLMRSLTACPVVDLTGETPIGLLPALLSKACVLITNDSGPMHVAAAVGRPVVSIFGPTSAVRTGPYGAGHTVLTHDLPCRPCFSRVCRNAVPMECLESITPEQVVAAVVSQQSCRAVSR
ncbi:MAG: glycosyltransferase family 9 protein [Nitrospira sp.]|nr:glycosyltransferase family 9 protein [Nitrospira sp.]